MSVFTTVAADELSVWLAGCDAGELLEHAGVEGGVENTNYSVRTTEGRFVLTLFERMPRGSAEAALALTDALAREGLAVAVPWPQASSWTAPLCGKPAALAQWLDGEHPERPSPAQIHAIGMFLGRMHGLHGLRAPADGRDTQWLRETAARVIPELVERDQMLLRDTLQEVLGLPGLTSGVIHADLFRDNALFEGDQLSGVIDFHYACVGPYLYDLAVVALDWVESDADLDALIAGYETKRSLAEHEREMLYPMVRRAALRFWLSRLEDALFPRGGQAVLVKDPDVMRDRLLRWT